MPATMPAGTSAPDGGAPRSEPFLMDVRHRPVARGEAQLEASLRGVWRGLVVTPILLGLCLVPLNGFLLRVMWNDYRLDHSGELVQGMVVDRSKDQHDDEKPEFTLHYEFRPGNGDLDAYEGSHGVTEGEYNAHPKGSALSIRFLRSNPNVSRPASEESQHGRAVVLLITCLCITGITLYMWWMHMAKDALKRRRLARSCVLLPGEVISARGRSEGDEPTTVVEFRFKTPDGRSVKSEQDELNTQLGDQPFPQPGDRVVVAYLDAETFMLL